MTDVHNKETRSFNMSMIKGKDTKPEMIVRKFLFANGFRFRKNDKRYPGSPDIILPMYKTAIFVNGCFWHGHKCKYGKLPETRNEFWTKKISENKNRDKINEQELLKLGWKVIRIWQCEISNKKKRQSRLKLLINQIKIE